MEPDESPLCCNVDHCMNVDFVSLVVFPKTFDLGPLLRDPKNAIFSQKMSCLESEKEARNSRPQEACQLVATMTMCCFLTLDVSFLAFFGQDTTSPFFPPTNTLKFELHVIRERCNTIRKKLRRDTRPITVREVDSPSTRSAKS